MSYPRDLDEYSAAELHAELRRRLWKRRQGLCDYCGREPITSLCRFPERHNIVAAQVLDDLAVASSEDK